MWKPELWKNKIFGIIIIALGVLTLAVEKDATFLIWALVMGLFLFFSKEDCIF